LPPEADWFLSTVLSTVDKKEKNSLRSLCLCGEKTESKTMLRVFKQYYPIRNIFFVIGEGLVIYVSVFLAALILLGTESFATDSWLFLKILLITFVCQACLYYTDLYDLTITDDFKELGIRLLQALGFASIILAFIYLIFPTTIIGTGIFVVSIGILILLIVSWRFSYSLVLNHGFFNQKIILLGRGKLAENIKKEIYEKKDCGYVVSLEISQCSTVNDENNTTKIITKDYQDLGEKARALGINKVVVALKEKRGAFPTKELLKCRVGGIEVIDGNSFYEMLAGKLIVEQINPAWLIFSDGFEKSLIRRLFKRTIDWVLSLILLILFFPLIVLIAVLIKADSKGPVFYSQPRIGEKRKLYRMHKFRSMVDNAEKDCGPVCAQEDDIRITRVGRLLRKWRIDEIPQLWNVLKGEMSFVGPRPEREFFVEKYETKIPYYGERYSVKPGITGWAQISYKYSDSIESTMEKLNYDLFYIKNMTTMMDLMIVMRTIKIVLFGKGAR
jgi:sugar transferase (PEP-CTERM system associated)